MKINKKILALLVLSMTTVGCINNGKKDNSKVESSFNSTSSSISNVVQSSTNNISSSTTITSSNSSSSNTTSSSISSTSSNNSSSSSGNDNSNVPKGYTSILTSEVKEARVVPSDMGLEAVKEYNGVLSTNPTTFDYLANKNINNINYYCNFVDNLLEHDQYGQIRGALAEDCFYNEDFTKLRFRLRKGVKWVDAGGNERAEVVADDFVASLQHLLDAKGGLENMAYYIYGAKAYADGVNTDFDNVGIHVYNDYEFEYILEESYPYFHTLFESTAFLPLNREFFISTGGAFGSEWDPEESDFGKLLRSDILLYCGPYILTEFESYSSLSMRKNTSYWDVGNVQIDNINYVYYDINNLSHLVNVFKNNELTSLDVNQENYDIIVEEYSNHIYEKELGTTTNYFNWNLNRQTYELGDCRSGKLNDSVAQENTKKAILNESFRKAVFSAIPKIQMNAIADDNNTANVTIRNSYTTPEFVTTTGTVTNETTGVKHEGTNYYYQLLNNEMKAQNEVNGDNYARFASSWDANSGVEISSEENESTFADKENSYYNEETARMLRNKAKKELGDTVTYPIQIDYLTYDASDIYLAKATILKSKVEKILGSDFITINLQSTSNSKHFDNSHFMASSGSKMNFDLSSGTSWGPDYGDPTTFLNTFAWEGELQSYLGFDNNEIDKNTYYSVLGDYMKLYEEATAEISNTNLRYAKLAAAEAELLNSAVIMPNTTDGGGYAVSRIVPRTNQRAFYGSDQSRFKYMVVVDQVLTIEQRKAIITDWENKF